MSYVIREKTWRMDRRVPLMVLLTLLVHLAAALIWGAQLDVRVVALERTTQPLQAHSEQLGRIEERLDSLRKDNDQMRHKLDAIMDKLMK